MELALFTKSYLLNDGLVRAARDLFCLWPGLLLFLPTPVAHRHYVTLIRQVLVLILHSFQQTQPLWPLITSLSISLSEWLPLGLSAVCHVHWALWEPPKNRGHLWLCWGKVKLRGMTQGRGHSTAQKNILSFSNEKKKAHGIKAFPERTDAHWKIIHRSEE